MAGVNAAASEVQGESACEQVRVRTGSHLNFDGAWQRNVGNFYTFCKRRKRRICGRVVPNDNSTAVGGKVEVVKEQDVVRWAFEMIPTIRVGQMGFS